MRSCSRIARRCGEVEASTSGVASAAHRFLRDPDLLGRPLARPLGREGVVVRVVDGIVGRVQLDEVGDVEAACAGGGEKLAVRQLPLDAELAGPLEATQPPLWPLRASRSASLRRGRRGGRACCCGGTTSRPPGRRSRYASGIQRWGSHQMLAPYSETARSKLSDGKRDVLGARLDEWELEPELGLAASRGRELGRRDVDADGARAAPGEPRRDVRRAAAELDDVEPVDVAERAERRLGTPKTPQVISPRPSLARARHRCTRRSPASSPRGCASRRRRSRSCVILEAASRALPRAGSPRERHVAVRS